LKEKHMMKRFQPDASTSEEDMVPLVLPLAALDRSKLSIGGGKAANLGELIQAGLRVPAGFCITTAAYERVATQAALDSSLAGLEAVSHEDRALGSCRGAPVSSAFSAIDSGTDPSSNGSCYSSPARTLCFPAGALASAARSPSDPL
jgi:hypothetical protein